MAITMTFHSVKKIKIFCGLFVISCLACGSLWKKSAAQDSSTSNFRVRNGLQAIYDFRDTTGAIVKDQAGVGTPVNLKIANLNNVIRKPGLLDVKKKTLIRSVKPANRITESIRKSNECSLEVWLRTATMQQKGPARIVTLSRNSGERNFTLGQENSKIEVRFRTTKTSTNGIPSVSTKPKTLPLKLTHLVYTRNRNGQTRIYIDGKKSKEQHISGNTSSWNSTYHLALANELSNDRPWVGTLYLVAVYNRALQPEDVVRNFKAGHDVLAKPKMVVKKEATAEHFETEIAAIISNHCLDCHDSTTKEGQLDLSRKKEAFKGGENGPVIVPGSSSKSSLWNLVKSNEMPEDHPPLSNEEKKLLKQWIEAGAIWSLEQIDPAVYVHGPDDAKNWVRRLTVQEYIASVKSSLGVDISKQARNILPADMRADGFSNTAYNLNVDLKHVEAYARLAEIIVSQMDIADFARKYSKSERLTDRNMRPLISQMGKLIYRAPLNEQEIATLRGISTTVASTGGDFQEAVSLILEAMLQSPRFLYRIENQQGDGTLWSVEKYELANRISYILWGGPPDQKLIRAAEDGKLSGDDLKKEIKRMLAVPQAKERSLAFIHDWLNLSHLDNLRPSPKRFPDWNPKLASDMRRETLAFYEEVVWKQKRPLSDLFNAQITFLTPELAKHYGIEPQGRGLVKYDLKEIPSRGGLLTQGAILSVGGDDASMVTRGLFIMHELLRGVVKDPPPGIDTTKPPTTPGRTQRDISLTRIANPACGGCHIKFEPLAFGLEKFDGLGSFHEVDQHNNKLRDDGEILFPGEARMVTYNSSAELMDRLAGSERVKKSLAWKLTQFSIGRPLTAIDARTVEKIHQLSQKNGGTYEAFITAIILSDLVQKTRTEK